MTGVSSQRGPRDRPGAVRRSAVLKLVAWALLLPAAQARAGLRLHRVHGGLAEVIARMNDAAKRLRTVSADLDYTTVTVLVNDQSTETGKFYLRNPRRPDILIRFDRPDQKTILFRGSKAEIYLPKIKRIEEYDLTTHQGLVQQFLLLGFGTDAKSLKHAYTTKLVGEQSLGRAMTATLDLVPHNPQIASQLAHIQLWVSEDSWLPVQQKFFETSGDYLVARYRDVEVNKRLPASMFKIRAEDATRVKMR